MKNTKYKKELPTLDLEKVLSVDEAVEMVTSQPKRKFVESVDVAVSLGIDPKKIRSECKRFINIATFIR